MIKVNCGFSRKVGEANYGSRGASVNLELELATEAAHDGDALQDKIKRMFILAKKAVDDELNGQAAPADPPARNGAAARGGQRAAAGSLGGNGDGLPEGHGPGGNGDGQPGNGSAASTKQVKLIMDLARTRKMNLSVIERL